MLKNFTNQYSLTKTLRFELAPVGETLENMKRHLEYDENLQTFLKDQEIEDAYQALKPIIDKLHETFIMRSLESDEAKKIIFSGYFDHYKDKTKSKEKDIKDTEKKLRVQIGKTFAIGEQYFRKTYPEFSWKIDSKEAKGADLMNCEDLLKVIEKEYGSSDDESAKKIKEHVHKFDDFFTYLSGFRKNRANYYHTDKEKETAIATRIVHENLPKFCSNSVIFNKYADQYNNLHRFLQEKEIATQDKKGKQLDEINAELFDIKHFNNCLSQPNIEKYNEKIGEANALINLYNQQKETTEKLPSFKTLYKQIGCGKRDTFFFALKKDKEADLSKEEKQNNNEIFSLEKLIQKAKEQAEKTFEGDSENELNTLADFVRWLKNQEDWNGIYWSSKGITNISGKYFANWHSITEIIANNAKDFKNVASVDKKREEVVKMNKAVEISGFFTLINQYATGDKWQETIFKKSLLDEKDMGGIIQNSKRPSDALIALICHDLKSKSKEFSDKANDIVGLLDYRSEDGVDAEGKVIVDDKGEVVHKGGKTKIKEWLDMARTINQTVSDFRVKEGHIKGAEMNAELSEFLDRFLANDWYQWYMVAQSWLTKKPQDDAKESKLKLNFENVSLADGWDINKEVSNTCVMLRDKESKIYLAVMTKKHSNIFKSFIKQSKRKEIKNPLYSIGEDESWQKMEYKLLPKPYMQLPRCLIPKKDPRKYGASDEILEIYENGKFKKDSEEFSLSNLHKFIDFYKSAISQYEDWGVFNFDFSDTKKYEIITQFYAEVEKQGYKLNFKEINRKVLFELINEGKMYLFEIRSKDSGEKSTGKPNLQTIYWQQVFSESENRPKLNGRAEIFFRKNVLPAKITHKANMHIPRKNKNKTGHGSIFKHDLIKDKRFTENKFFFHCPIMLNFCMDQTNINGLINQDYSSEKTMFLGLDRGEKHLIYYALVDEDGNMIENGQGSFNKINDFDYWAKLVEIEGKRKSARKNWQTIDSIKNLKEGYISQVVHEIVKKVTANKTWIVLEDLNTGFKRGRQKIERQVYEKFELALAKKLNFVVHKDAKIGELGSVTKAIQLTPPVNNYGDIENRKQVGVMLYTRANYTSQTDPATGWRKTIYLQPGSEEAIRDEIFAKFTEIGFDGKDYYFTYQQQLDNWTLWSSKNGVSLDRYRGKRGLNFNEWTIESFDIKKMLDKILSRKYQKSPSGWSLNADTFYELEPQKWDDKHTAWGSLLFVINLIQQIRNSDGKGGESDNFLLSPVRDKAGNHFDSRKAPQGLPIDADANGAFNIARKGVLMQAHIRQWIKEGKKKYDKYADDLDLFISDEEWDLWLNHREEWKRQLPQFSSRKAMEKKRSEKTKTNKMGRKKSSVPK